MQALLGVYCICFNERVLRGTLFYSNVYQLKDLNAQAETYASSSIGHYTTNDPATGSPRTTDALVVDVTNLETGCLVRLTFGKPLSALPEPGKNL
jgi:hypothetical protein